MKRTYILERYDDLQANPDRAKRMTYAIKIEGESEFEIDKFLGREDIQKPRFKDAYERILQTLYTMVNRTGFLIGDMRPEDDYAAIPRGASELRYLLIPWTSRTAILGGGGFKLKGIRTHQESNDLVEHRNNIKDVYARLKRYVKENGLTEGEFGGFFDEDGFCEVIILTPANE